MNIVLEFASDGDFVEDFDDFLRTRGSLLLTTRWIAHRVRKIPFFWTRLILSPIARLYTLKKWIFFSARLPLYVWLRAIQLVPPPPLSPNNNLDNWVQEAILLLSMQMDRCATLSIVADSSGLIDDA